MNTLFKRIDLFICNTLKRNKIERGKKNCNYSKEKEEKKHSEIHEHI